MKILHNLPLDEWFDDVPHPYDSWPMATDKPRSEEDLEAEISLHEKMYRLAVEKHSPWKGGGSENWHANPNH